MLRSQACSTTPNLYYSCFWDSVLLCSPDWPRTCAPVALAIWSAGVGGSYHHAWLIGLKHRQDSGSTLESYKPMPGSLCSVWRQCPLTAGVLQDFVRRIHTVLTHILLGDGALSKMRVAQLPWCRPFSFETRGICLQTFKCWNYKKGQCGHPVEKHRWAELAGKGSYIPSTSGSLWACAHCLPVWTHCPREETDSLSRSPTTLSVFTLYPLKEEDLRFFFLLQKPLPFVVLQGLKS